MITYPDGSFVLNSVERRTDRAFNQLLDAGYDIIAAIRILKVLGFYMTEELEQHFMH